MSETKIYLDFSNNIQQLLADNGLTIEHILQQENIEVAHVTQGFIPDESEEGGRTKDLVPIIFVSSALIISIGFAISKVVNTLKAPDGNTRDTFEVRFNLNETAVIKFRSEVKDSENADK